MSIETNSGIDPIQALLDGERLLTEKESSGSGYAECGYAEKRRKIARKNLEDRAFNESIQLMEKLQISRNIIEKYRIGIDYAPSVPGHETEKSETAAIIPVEGKYGANNLEINLIGFETIVTNERNPVHTFLSDHLNGNTEKVYIVPDVFSAIILTENGFPAIAAGIGIPDGDKALKEDQEQYSRFLADTASEIIVHDLTGKQLVFVRGKNGRKEKRAPDITRWNKNFMQDLIEYMKSCEVKEIRECRIDFFTAARAARNGKHLLRRYLNRFTDLSESSGNMNDLQYLDYQMQDRLEEFRELNYGTGFSYFDEVFGKMAPGLYCIGGLTGCGKTTFALQIADQVAEAGNPVMYFSLEQSREELTMKSISRIASEKYGVYVSSMDLITGFNRDPQKCSRVIQQWNKDGGITSAFRYYRERIAPNKWTLERDFNADYTEIEKKIELYIRTHDKIPLVIVDYLQVLSLPEGAKKTDTEAINEIVEGLKQISKRYTVPIIVLSALNRESYNTPISNSDFKQSGQIEYTADFLFGLNYTSIQNGSIVLNKQGKERTKTELKKAVEYLSLGDKRKLSLAVLKSRGRSKAHLYHDREGNERYTNLFNFIYYPRTDRFVEIRGEPNIQRTLVRSEQ